MKQIKHLLLETILIIGLVVTIIMLMRHRLEADFQLQNGSKVSVHVISEKEINPTIAVFLNGRAITEIVPYGNKYSIRILTKDGGNTITAHFQQDKDAPTDFNRGVIIGGKKYLITYNDAGEIDQKIEIK